MANLPLRLAVRGHCGQQVRRGTLGVLTHSRGTRGVLSGYSSPGIPPWEQYTAKNAPLPSAERAFPPSPAGSSARARLNDRMRSLQGLELLVTVLLARNRQPPPTVAAGVPHAELAAELVSLPSGLLAMVCEAIVKLKVRRGVACVCALVAWAIGEGPTRSRRVRTAATKCCGVL